MAKKVIISVISDLATDQRIHRSASTLHEQGFEVEVIGRKLPGSMDLPERPYQTKRFNLWFHKGPFFYLNYNCRLFWYLMFSKADVLFSNDLDTLPANYYIAKWKKLPLVYDSHEYFTGVPELVNRHRKRNIWKSIERKMVPKVDVMFTVNESIAGLYKEELGVKAIVLRNVPEYFEVVNVDKTKLRQELNLPVNKSIYILQGSGINIQRGAEEMVEAMQFISSGVLLIIGGGDVIELLKSMVKQLHLEEKVMIKSKMPQQELKKFTMAADIGLSLDKDLSINYRFSLPNKLFDYIHAGLPVLASDLPEVRKIVEHYKVGMIAKSHDPKELASLLQKMTHDTQQMDQWKHNALLAAKELNWQKEKLVLIYEFQKYI